MKRLKAKISILIATTIPFLLPAAVPVGDVTLAWDPSPTNEAIIAYHVFGTNNIAVPVANWPRLATVPVGTTNATIRIVPGEFFFVVASSNLWGISPPSNVAASPALPSPPVTTIKRAQ